MLSGHGTAGGLPWVEFQIWFCLYAFGPNNKNASRLVKHTSPEFKISNLHTATHHMTYMINSIYGSY